ncbi:MAG: DNA polymerase IV [Candidatus Woykebacteria bacterium]
MRANWMHIDMDAFFASVEVKINPVLEGKPVLVGRVDPHGRSVPRGVVATASYEARKFGARSGMPLFQALRLCPQCTVVGGHYEEYIKASDAVFSICARWAPKIEYSSLDEAFLDFSGTELIYQDLVDVARKIKETVKGEVGITASIGIAATKVVAKVASDHEKPDGLTYVKAGTEKEFLAPLPIKDLPGIGRKMEEYFHRLGVKTLGELAAVPYEKIRSWGQFAINIWKAANGADNIWFTPRTQVKSVSRSETFPKNSADIKFILAMLQHLAEKVGEEVRSEGYSGRCVYVTIRYSDFRTASRQRVLPYPTSSTKEIYEMGKQLLEEFWDHNTSLRLVGIGISQFARLPDGQGETVQSSLFDGVRNKRLDLEKRVDHLREKFGKGSVVPASLMKLGKVRRV